MRGATRIIDLTSGAATDLLHDAVLLDASPAGRSVLAVNGWGTDNAEIVVAAVDGTTTRMVAKNPGITTVHDFAGAFLDEDRVVFAHERSGNLDGNSAL